MKIKTFIDRPILAGVISVLIFILGLIGLAQLPIEQFPEVAPPTVSVSATYSGANAETVQKSVVVPLEEALNGVENMTYMTSTSSNNGSAKISVYFRQGTDPDMATVNVQNRIATAQGLLPAEVTKSGITVRKRQTSNIKQLAVYSPDDSFDEAFLTNYMKINIEPRLSRIAGVGEVNVFGYEYSMRIWLDPNKMRQYNLIPADIASVLDEQNVEAATGTLGAEAGNTFQYVLKYRGRYENEADYENLVIKSLPDGGVLRLKDVATVELGTRAYDYINEVNGHPGCNIMIAQTSGSNANEIIEEIDRTVAEISETLPEGIKIADLMSTKDFIDASIKNVVKTLAEAIVLVVLVVYIFLQSFRSTLIPALSIIVSLVGTFAFLYIAGFSLNMLTLFALVLVIGTVVDDAIVVVDAARCKRNGVSPADVLGTLSGYIGGNYASNMNRFSKLYRVMVQAPPEFRLDTESLNNMFVRGDNGLMSPVSQYLRLTRVYGSEVLTRFNLFSAIQVNGSAAAGYSSGQAIEAVREVAGQTLPTGYGFEFEGMSREESSSGNTAALVFAICVVFIYLILCALYESLFVPLAVILSVPFGLAGSFLFARMFGLENNIYLQTGLIMLIGLLSKTAILLTDYASDRRRSGMSLMQAAVSAAKVRLRPILMTPLTMIFGMLPMMFSKGVGANGNIFVGVGTVGGMLVGTVALLFVVPPLFVVFRRMQERLMPARSLPPAADSPSDGGQQV